MDHPLLNSQNFESAINVMNIFESDEVLAVKETDNFFYHNGKGLIPFKNLLILFLKEEVYRHISSLHLFTKKCLLNYDKKRKTGHVILDDISSFRVRSNEDLIFAETLIKNN